MSGADDAILLFFAALSGAGTRRAQSGFAAMRDSQQLRVQRGAPLLAAARARARRVWRDSLHTSGLRCVLLVLVLSCLSLSISLTR